MTEQKNSKALHIALWVVQIGLAASFGMAGFMKSTSPLDKLLEGGMTFVNNYSEGTIRFIGISQLLAAIGLILPAALRILPILTPLAATGLGTIMVLAMQYHLSHNEPITSNLVLLALTAFVAWGRFKGAPIKPKG